MKELYIAQLSCSGRKPIAVGAVEAKDADRARREGRKGFPAFPASTSTFCSRSPAGRGGSR